MIDKKQLNVEQLLQLPDDFAEKLILKQLINPESTDSSFFIYSNFQDSWFKKQEYGELFKVLKGYYFKYQAFPSKVLLNKIIESPRFESIKNELVKTVNDIYDIKESDYEKDYLRDMIVKFTKERAIYFTVLDNIDTIEKHGDISACFQKFEEIAKYDLNSDLGIEYFENINKHIDRLSQPEAKISTGIKGLDKVLYGGIPVDDTCLFLFMAQPGLGKSMFMTNIAANWILMNKKVLIITLEMSEHMYSMRMDSIFSDININKLKDAPENLLKRIKALKLGVPAAQLQIKEFPTGTCSAMMIKQYMKKLKEIRGFEPDLIIVDYLNIMRSNSGNSSSGLYEKGKAIAEELRALSGEKHKTIISAIQSNRSGSGFANKEIDIDNSAESAGIPATADAMIGVFQLEGEREAGKINLKILKNRLGGFIGHIIPLEVNYETLKISDWDDETLDLKNKDSLIEHDKNEINSVLDNL